MSEVQHPNHSSWQRSFLCWLFVIIRIFPTGLKKDMIGIISLTLNTDTRFGAILVRNQFLDGGIPSVYNPKLYNSKPILLICVSVEETIALYNFAFCCTCILSKCCLYFVNMLLKNCLYFVHSFTLSCNFASILTIFVEKYKYLLLIYI